MYANGFLWKLFYGFRTSWVWCSFVCVCGGGGVKTGILSCPGTYSVDQVDLNLRGLPISASRVLGLKDCVPPPLRCSCLRGYSVSYPSIAEKRPYLNVWYLMLLEFWKSSSGHLILGACLVKTTSVYWSCRSSDKHSVGQNPAHHKVGQAAKATQKRHLLHLLGGLSLGEQQQWTWTSWWRWLHHWLTYLTKSNLKEDYFGSGFENTSHHGRKS